jgi:hypothetical protein
MNAVFASLVSALRAALGLRLGCARCSLRRVSAARGVWAAPGVRFAVLALRAV